LHPYAFAMAPHNITDPIGANANAPITRSASKYQIQGNRLCGVAFIIGILNHKFQVNVFGLCNAGLVTLLIPCFSAQSHTAANSVGPDLCAA
jgi:hypothetical protein